MPTKEKSIAIIGAGFAGLATGIYARLNGYKADIFEMHNIPGGLCTSWTRKGFTFDGCIHWLVGSSPDSGMHDIWEETGIAQGREFINLDEYLRIEDKSGRTLVFYTDTKRLEKHLLEFSPKDEKPIKEFIDGIRLCSKFNTPSKKDSFLVRMKKQIGNVYLFIKNGKKFRYWMQVTSKNFASGFSDPTLREAFSQIWIPEFSMFFVLFTFAYLNDKNAGYPLGGSKPMADALEKRFTELGGKIHYKSKVVKIITNGDVASGIRLENGTEYFADRIISAADGHSTIFNMLDGKYGNEKDKEPYDKWPIFPPLIFISIGVNRKFNDVPSTISGLTFYLDDYTEVADRTINSLTVHIYNHDPAMAPEGKTSLTIMLKTDYDYWKELGKNREKYDEKKDEVVRIVSNLLEKRFPGICSQIEVSDVATPLTFERFTGNWKGSFEGWLITPENAGVVMKPMEQTINGLTNFYMCGQWVEPGGGLPTALLSAKRLMKKICREDKRKFIR
jgi:phytoene dehydrogenase-like protein